MLVLKIGDKELKVKYGYEATLKSRLISKMSKFQSRMQNANNDERMEKMEELLLFVPELLLVGLQKNHAEYKYDYEKGTGKEELLPAMFELIEGYCDEEGKDAYILFNELQEEMLQNGFLKSMFQLEMKKVEQQEKAAEN